MEPYLWSGAVVKVRLAAGLGRSPRDAWAEEVRCARGRPALPRCADCESGDKMIDRVLLPW